jgi:hypothetical protein
MNKTIAALLMFLRKRTTFLLLIACLALLSLTACYDPDRGAGTLRDTTPDHVLTIEISTDHVAYKFGEPVNIRAKLTNISSQAIFLQSQSGKEPILNVIFQRGPYDAPIERHDWSQEHPDQVKYTLQLAPTESHEIEWTLMPVARSVYIIVVPWVDNLGYSGTSGFGISYDVPKL